MLERPGEAGYVSIRDEPHCPVCGAVLRYCGGHQRGENRYSIIMPHLLQTVAEGGQVKALRAGDNWGYFSGDPVARWRPDGESMLLMEPFSYVDRHSHKWTAPKGSILDGASIPRAFWTLVGSPYRGRYRYASIVHDYYCVSRSEPWQAVHFMFYEACMASGTGHTHAKVLYYAVRHFGPRWGEGLEAISAYPPAEVTIEQLGEIERWIVEANPLRSEIDNYPPERFASPPAPRVRKIRRPGSEGSERPSS